MLIETGVCMRKPNQAMTNCPPDYLCYHCSSPIAQPEALEENLAGHLRYFCCPGCLAIAKTIHGEGLDIFYTRRREANAKPSSALTDDQISERLLAYDDPSLLSRFTRPAANEDDIETTLKLEKIRCAACVWLCENHLRKQPGVKDIQINYVTQKARIIFTPRVIHLSTLLFEIERIGYEAWPFEPSLSFEKARKERRQLLARLGVALLGMMQVMMYAWPSYVGTANLTPDFNSLLAWTSWLFTVPVMLYSAAPIFRSAWQSIGLFVTSRQLNMDVPIALALGLAFFVGTINTLARAGPSYFDSITMFVAFVLLARYVELLARQDAQSGAEALAKQLPATCERYVDYPLSPQIQVVPVVNCRVGEIIRVRAGDVIPMDAVVLDSASSVNEALLTGESKSIQKNMGDPVFAGTHNIVNPLILKIVALGQSTRIAGIASLLDQALAAKPVLLRKTENWAGLFVVLLMFSAFLSAAAWLFVDPSRSWTVLMAVLVASCPCALSLAIPTALAASQGTATKLGLLIVRGHVMECIAKATDLVIDKTGTITLGEPELISIENLRAGLTEAAVLSVAAALEVAQQHPLAVAISRAARDRDIATAVLQEPVKNYLGRGLVSGNYRLGSSDWLGLMPVDMDGQYGQVHLSDENGRMASFIFLDQFRPGLADLLEAARSRGINVHLISGDDPGTVFWWAAHVGIKTYRGACSPEDKYQYVQALQEAGGLVLAIGDGINDAPLLAKANVSIAVGAGAPLAVAGADAVLTSGSLAPLSKIMGLSHRTRLIIKMNLIWACVYNSVMIPIAMLGLINPWIAGIGMSLSSLLVTLNAWRLRKA